MDCKFCKKVVKQPEGKRKKEFCDNTCRSNFWYAKNKKGNPTVKIDDQIKPNKEVKPPKTLQEIKDLCPKELAGFERSAWVSTERQKYGI